MTSPVKTAHVLGGINFRECSIQGDSADSRLLLRRSATQLLSHVHRNTLIRMDPFRSYAGEGHLAALCKISDKFSTVYKICQTYTVWKADDGINGTVVIQMATSGIIASANSSDVLRGGVRCAFKDGPASSRCQIRNRVCGAVLHDDRSLAK